MDISTFISETLSQIASGVHEANKSVLAHIPKKSADPYFVVDICRMGDSDAIGTVNFDIAVTARSEKKGGAGGKLRVHVVEAQAGGEKTSAHETVSRVQFKVRIENPMS